MSLKWLKLKFQSIRPFKDLKTKNRRWDLRLFSNVSQPSRSRASYAISNYAKIMLFFSKLCLCLHYALWKKCKKVQKISIFFVIGSLAWWAVHVVGPTSPTNVTSGSSAPRPRPFQTVSDAAEWFTVNYKCFYLN